MEYLMEYIRPVNAAIGGLVGWFIGGNDSLLYALIAFVVVDYIIMVP